MPSQQDEHDEHLAYGEYHDPHPDRQGEEESSRGFLGHAWRRLRASTVHEHEHQHGVEQHEAALAVSHAPPRLTFHHVTPLHVYLLRETKNTSNHDSLRVLP